MTFHKGDKCKDAIGRVWYVDDTVTFPKGERLLAIKRDKPLTNQYPWAIAIDNRDGTATVFEATGFTTVYKEEEKE